MARTPSSHQHSSHTSRRLPSDPAYSPHGIITRRLIDANKLHSSRLAERCTVPSSRRHPNIHNASHRESSLARTAVHPLALLASDRTRCPQTDDGIAGGSSSAARSVTDVRLTPPERAAPHRIVVPADPNRGACRGELDGASYGVDDDAAGSARIKNATWNAVTALSTLIDEANELERVFSTTLLPSVVLFSAPSAERLDEAGETRRHSELLKSMGKFVPTLQLVQNGCVRMKRLVRNMVVQLGGCVTPGNGSIENEENGGEQSSPVFAEDVSLLLLGKAIGTALRILITVDEAVAKNDDLREAWSMFKDVVMDHSEEKRAANALGNDFESFERLLIQLDYNLMSSRSFISTIEQNFDPNGRFQAANYNLYLEIHSMINSMYGQYCERINTENETTERLDCVGVYAMYVLYRHLLPSKVVPDAKLHKSLWMVFPAMCPVLELHGPLYFIPREFIMLHAPYEAVKGCSADLNDIRQGASALVLKWDGSFKTRVNKIRFNALAWLAVADAELSPTVIGDDGAGGDEFDPAASVENIENATSCILRGMKIAHSAGITLRSQLITHKALGLEHDPDHVASCLSLVVILKSVEKMLRVRRRAAFNAFQRGTLKMIASNILKRFESIRAFVDQYSTSESSRSPEHARSFARVTACLSALEGILKGSSSFSPIRRYAISLAVAVSLDSMVLERFATNDLSAVEGNLRDLNEIAEIDEILYKACDCSFLYFYRDLYPSFFDHIYETSLSSSVGHTNLVIFALSDTERILNQVKHVGGDAFLEDHQSYILHLVENRIVVPTCELIEFNLRFAHHSKANNQYNSNDNDQYNDKHVRSLLLGLPLYVGQKKVDVKSKVEEVLGEAFYKLCTLSPNECNTYNEIRSLANERYDLQIMEPYLPGGNMNQRFDLIDIVRDFESFIRKFNYNMMEQVFVERQPQRGAKFLSTFGTNCVSASITQHGPGIIKLAVDVAYELLAQKFQLFTEFLTNDYVKSLLAKEFRWFTNKRTEGNSLYPFDRAASFAHDMNKLESVEDGGSPLDDCRDLLVSIGNIIAFVRLARTASKNVASDEMPYLQSKLPESLIETSKLMSGIYNHQLDSDYIRAFVDIFKVVFEESNAPPKNGFFCLVPALCLNWIDASIQGKEMMHKKNITRDGYYTDDGFAVGLIFCLTILDQIEQYESLHWFKAVQNKYAVDEEDLIEKENAEEVKKRAKSAAYKQGSWFSPGVEAPQDENEDMTVLKMMRKRLDANKREMAMLFFTMNGSERFFKDIRSPAV